MTERRKKIDKKWPTDNEERHRWCDDCQGKYIGVRECPSCGGKNTAIDEVVLRVPKRKLII